MTVEEIVKRVEGVANRSLGKSTPEKFNIDNTMRYIGDAYVVVSTMLRKPIVQDSATTTTIGLASYNIPVDCLGNISGIIAVEYNGRPLVKTEVHTLQERYFDEWREPEDIIEVMFYLEYDDEEKIFLVLPPELAATLKFVYVQKPTQPTALTDTVPRFIEPYVPYIPDYVMGRIMGNDKQGRGSRMIAQFEALIMQQVRRDKRNRVVRPGREAYSQAISNYHDTYGRRNRNR